MYTHVYNRMMVHLTLVLLCPGPLQSGGRLLLQKHLYSMASGHADCEYIYVYMYIYIKIHLYIYIYAW